MDIYDARMQLFSHPDSSSLREIMAHEEVQPVYFFGGAFRIVNKRIEQVENFSILTREVLTFSAGFVMTEKAFEERLNKEGIVLKSVCYIHNDFAIKIMADLAIIDPPVKQYELMYSYFTGAF